MRNRLVVRLAFGAVLGLFLVAPLAAEPGWKKISAESLGGTGGVVHERVEVASGARKVVLHFAYFDARKHDLRVVDDPDSRFSGLSAAMRGAGALAGVNGGYFHPDYRPVGLVVEDGEQRHGQETAKLLSGIVATNRNRIFLLRPAEFKNDPNTLNALQAGPYLVDDSRGVTGLEFTRQARRTAILTDGKNNWALVSTTPVTLAELSEILAGEHVAARFPVRRALNLDGGSSTGFWVRKDDTAFYQRERVRVRNYLAVVPRAG